MADLLILFSESAPPFEIEAAAKKRGARVKMTSEISSAREWLEMKLFDIVCVYADLPVEFQTELAGLLWGKNQVAAFVVYDFQKPREAGFTLSRLNGAEVAIGPDGLQVIDGLLELIPERTLESQDDFHIMVVEDLDSARDIICAYLENLGYTKVTGFESAARALEELHRDPKRYSCVLTDIRMPQMTGEQLILEVRTDPQLKHLPVVVLTAYGTPDCLVDCMRAGASGFLVKPPKKGDILREMNRARRISFNGRNPRMIAADDIERFREQLLARPLS